jgi:serine O-acetyltransferase
MGKQSGGLFGDLRILFSDRGTGMGKPGLKEVIRIILVKPGAQALALYRIYHWLYKRGLSLLPEVLSRLNFFLTGARIDPGAEIGPGCHLLDSAGVGIGQGVVIGSNVWIHRHVSVGGGGTYPFTLGLGDRGWPRIGNNVVLFIGVSVLGNLEVGDNTVVGAHSLVLESLPPDCLAFGVPAKVVKSEPPEVEE